MFGIIKKTFILLLASIVNASNHRKCISLSNKKCEIQPTLINLHPFAVKLDRCAESCNTLNDLSNKVYVTNKAEDLNLTMFNMIAGINESKTLTKHYHVNVIVNLMEQNLIQISDGITINVNVSVKNTIHVKKIILGILLHVILKIENI